MPWEGVSCGAVALTSQTHRIVAEGLFLGFIQALESKSQHEAVMIRFDAAYNAGQVQPGPLRVVENDPCENEPSLHNGLAVIQHDLPGHAAGARVCERGRRIRREVAQPEQFFVLAFGARDAEGVLGRDVRLYEQFLHLTKSLPVRDESLRPTANSQPPLQFYMEHGTRSRRARSGLLQGLDEGFGFEQRLL